MSSKNHNQNLAKKAQKALKELGYDISLGHSYDLISKMSGYPNWDTASATGEKLLNGFENHGDFLENYLNELLPEHYLTLYSFSPRPVDTLISDLKKIVCVEGGYPEATLKNLIDNITNKKASNEDLIKFGHKLFEHCGIDFEFMALATLFGCYPVMSERGYCSIKDIRQLFSEIFKKGITINEHRTHFIKITLYIKRDQELEMEEEMSHKESNKLSPMGIDEMADALEEVSKKLPKGDGLDIASLMAKLTRKNARFQLTEFKGKPYFASEYFSDIKELQNAKKVSVKEFIKDTGMALWGDVEKMVLIPVK